MDVNEVDRRFDVSALVPQVLLTVKNRPPPIERICLPAHGWHLALPVDGRAGGALTDPTVVRQERGLLLHLIEDLLPLQLSLG